MSMLRPIIDSHWIAFDTEGRWEFSYVEDVKNAMDLHRNAHEVEFKFESDNGALMFRLLFL